jgi:uncharacterized protein (DUF1697 family)
MKYAAFLRGINVGGKNMIKMETLRKTFEGLGYENVKSYVNSGNIVFDTRKTDDGRLAKTIHAAIQQEFGFDISVMVRSMDEIAEIVADNPFDGQFDDHRYFHIFFLDRELSNDEKGRLLEQASDNEMISVDGRTIYYLLRISILDSALGKGFIDRKLKIPATGRNWRTITTVAAM